ncbi:MAG TPA: cysteine peptidase family C39 domain-containing protein [Clostridia bacterium]
MNIITYIIVSLLLGVALTVLGYRLSFKFTGKPKLLLALIFFILCLPGLLFLIMPLGIIKEPIWCINFRSIKGIELLSVFWCLFLSFITPKKDVYFNVRWHFFNNFIYILGIFLAVGNYMGYMLYPAPYDSFKNTWVDSVCIQSTGYTCAPSSVATVERYYGINTTEAEVAKALYTNTKGTKRYDIIRYLREKGYITNCIYEKDVSKIPSPALLEVLVMNGIPHSIAFFGEENGKFIIADPLSGKKYLTKDDFYKKYGFKGLSTQVIKPLKH